MDPRHPMTRRQRLIRLASGVAMIALGCVVFGVSKAYDPVNRAALIGIVLIFVGLTWLGQALRGHQEVVVHLERERPGRREASPTTTTAGILLGWLVPGLGHWIIGRRGKALLFFGVITITFVAGVLLAEGRNLNYDRDGVYFLAYMFNGLETALGWLWTRHLEYDHAIPHLQVGFLYAAVGSLLNLVVVIDFFNTCTRRRIEGPAQTALDTVKDVLDHTT